MHGLARREFDKLVNRDRSTAYDAGQLFRILEECVGHGVADWVAPVHVEKGCRLYMFSSDGLNMFVAVYGPTVLLVQISELRDAAGGLLLAQPIARMKEHFGK